MATIKYRLHKTGNTDVNIYVYASLGRNNLIETKTGFTINPNDWKRSNPSSKSIKACGKPKQNSATNKQLFNSLNALKTYLFEQLNKSANDGDLIDKFWLEQKIKDCFERKEKSDKNLLTSHIVHIINNASARRIKGSNKIGLSKARTSSYKSFLLLIESYQRTIRKQIHFTDINKPFIDKFTTWLLNEKKYSTNYAGKQLSNLKVICNDASNSLIEVNPYTSNIEPFKEGEADRHIQILSFEELQKIRQTQLPSTLDNVRKWILIGCEIGQRASDLLSITKDNLRYSNNNILIDLTQKKTGKNVTIPIHDEYIQEILEKEAPYSISTQKLNIYLKEVCRLAGIDKLSEGYINKKIGSQTGRNGKEIGIYRKTLGKYPKYKLITSHCFRRSFCTNYYKRIPTPILMEISAHSREQLFLQYIGKPKDRDENANLFLKLIQKANKDKKQNLKKVV